MKEKRNDLGQFQTQYNWPALIPRICDQFINGASLGSICAKPGYPSPWAVWNACNNNPEYRKAWRGALRAQMYLLDGEFDRLAEVCEEAVTDKQIDVVALRVWLNTLILKYSNLERAYAKYGAVKKPWTGQKEQSLEDELRAARKRLEDYKPRGHKGHIDQIRAKTQHG